MKQPILLFLLVSISLTACGTTVDAAPVPPNTVSPLPSPTETVSSTQGATVTQTPTITPSPTITPTPTTTRVHQGPKVIEVPILLYHRIDVSPVDSQYYVPPDKFEEQMKLLHDWEYTVIPINLLIKAIKEGADLPPRPIILTFDDGDISVYENAFPIMQKYGLTGVVYIVGNYINQPGYMSAEQIKELAAAGWEVGSHSMNHRDLRKLDLYSQQYEIVESRKSLQEATGLSVDTFAYPFGFMGSSGGEYVHVAGYTAAMGLGYTNDQGNGNLFWLQRRDIQGEYDIKRFILFLPWQGDSAFMPPDTPTPTLTPSRTPVPTYTMYPTSTTKP